MVFVCILVQSYEKKLIFPKIFRIFALGFCRKFAAHRKSRMIKRLFSIFLLAATCGTAVGQTAQSADALFKCGKWEEACKEYRQLARMDSRNDVFVYRYARCLGELGQTDESIEQFGKVSNIPLRDYFLAKEYIKAYRFTEAKETIGLYIESIRPTHERYASAMQMLETAEKGERWINRVEDVHIYAAEEVPSKGWRKQLMLSKEAGKIRPDGSFVNSLGDRRIYSDSLDHLYTQSRLLDEWSEPERLPFDGQNPFLASDGVTIYYSQASDEGLGGYDLYMSRYNTATNSYLQPSMLGMPYSSQENDLFYAFDEMTGKGGFVSEKSDSTVMIYRFVPREERRYLRDSSAVYVSRMARRQIIRPLQPTHVQTETAEPESSPLLEDEYIPEGDFRFVLNDSTVYTVLEDFQSDSARALYTQYQDIQEQIAEEEADLETYRETYLNSESAEEKERLTPLILSLEKDVARLKSEAATLPNEIRLTEH